MSILKGIKVGVSNIGTSYYDNNDSVILNVTPVDISDIGKVNEIIPVIYSGTELCPKPIVTVFFSDETRLLTEDVDYVLSYTNNVDVGIANITINGIGNYYGELHSNFEIINADMSVDTDGLGIVVKYDGEFHSDSVTEDRITLFGDNVPTIKYGIEEGTYNLNLPPQIKNTSESCIVYFQVSAKNHNSVIGSYLIEITPKEAILTWGNNIWIYDGEEHSTTCEVSNLISGDICDVILLNNSITNIGRQLVTATGLTNNNYILTSTESIELIVKPGMFYKVSGNWTPVKSVYKKVSGSWVKQEFDSAFSTSGNYVKK